MATCKMICRECTQSKNLSEFMVTSRLVHRCKSCISMNERLNKFRLRTGIELTYCQDACCPDECFGKDKRILRLRDDGKIACLGCLRHKKRRGGKPLHRKALQDYFEGHQCIHCPRVCSIEKLNIDFFEMVNSSMEVFPYTKFIELSGKKVDKTLKCLRLKIACIQCAREHITSHLR